MKEIDTVVLENDINYLILKEIDNNGSKYVYLSNENDPEDFCIRKSIIENDEEFLIGLSSKEEFDKALLLFSKEMI